MVYIELVQLHAHEALYARENNYICIDTNITYSTNTMQIYSNRSVDKVSNIRATRRHEKKYQWQEHLLIVHTYMYIINWIKA